MRIVRGIQNTVALSLHDNASTANPQWLFKLTNPMTGHSKIFAAEDVSDYTERYSLFRITETSDEDLTDGRVELTPSGRWSYTVYEMAESSPRNLDPGDALKVVKSDVCFVIDGSENQINNFTEEEEKDSGVFDVE